MAATPTISIGMSVRNNVRTVGQAVRSIVNQTFRDWELLVFDDGSTDGTVEIVRGFQDPRIRLFADGKRKGLPARLNEAIETATAELFARMDGDDVSYPDRLAVQVEYLRKHPDVDLVGGGILVFLDEGAVVGKRIPPELHKDVCRRPFRGFPIAHPTYCGRTNWFRTHRYREVAVRCEDQDLLLRSYAASRFGNVPQVVLGYREQTNLRKILLSRRHFAHRVLWHHLCNGHPLSGIRGYCEQVAKGVVDIATSWTSSSDRKVIRRATAVTDVEVKKWESLLAELNQVP